MATIAINISKNLREKLGEEGVQEFVSVTAIFESTLLYTVIAAGSGQT